MHTKTRLASSFDFDYIFMCALFENYAGHHKKLSTLHLFSFCLTHRKLKKRVNKGFIYNGTYVLLARVGLVWSLYQPIRTQNKSDKHVRNRRILPNG